MNIETEAGENIEVELGSDLNGNKNQETDVTVEESVKNIIEGNISKIKAKINILEERTNKTDFDVDLTEDEKLEALMLAKEGELRKAEKKANATQRNTEASIFFGTKILAGIGYVVNVIGQILLTILLFVLPLVLSGLVAEQLQKFIRREYGPQILAKYSDFLISKRRDYMAKRADRKIRGKDNYWGDVMSMMLYLPKVVVVLLIYVLVIRPAIHTIVMKVFLIFILACAILFICKIDNLLVTKSRDNESTSAEKRAETNMKMQNIMRESEFRAVNMTVADMTEKEKKNYLKATNKVIKKD